MCPLEAFREFISSRLIVAAKEIFTEVRRTLIQQREVQTESRLLETSTKEPQRDHFCIEETLGKTQRHSSPCQEDPEPPLIKEDPVVNQEADTVMATIIEEKTKHRDIVLTHDVVREFINVRLTAAAVEIFAMFQQTTIQYQKEVQAQCRPLEISLNPQIMFQKLDSPEQHVCEEEQLWNQEMNFSLSQEEPEAPQIKEEEEELEAPQNKEEEEEPKAPKIKEEEEEPEAPQIKEEEQDELFTSLEGEQLVVKQEVDMLIMIPTDESSETESTGELLISLDPVVAESHHQKKSQPVSTRSTRKAELKPNRKSHSKNVVNSLITGHSSLSVSMTTHTGEKPHSCETCGKGFRKKSNLLVHMRTHTNEKPHCCVTCGKCFRRKAHLLVHMRTHTGEKPHSCLTCGKSFSHKNSLLVHMRTHTGDKPYSCGTCGRSVSEYSNFVAHMRTHTGERPYSCLTCGKSFGQQSSLLGHIRTHTGEKPHSCVTCGKKFGCKSKLLVHMRTHTRVKPYSCVSCSQSFDYHCSLLSHMTIHKDVMPDFLECGESFSKNVVELSRSGGACHSS